MFQYDDGEEVVLWMNTVGPYHNRQETYAYFSLPFCQGPKQTISHYHETLGEALQGVELEFSGLQMDYKCKYSRDTNQSSANNSTPLRYLKNIRYSANIRGRIVGRLVA